MSPDQKIRVFQNTSLLRIIALNVKSLITGLHSLTLVVPSPPPVSLSIQHYGLKTIVFLEHPKGSDINYGRGGLQNWAKFTGKIL